MGATVTDFAKPAKISDVLRKCAEQVEYRIKAHEQKVREHQVIIEALRFEWGELLNDADRYERYQPKTDQAGGGEDA